jgi:hypothetical protein
MRPPPFKRGCVQFSRESIPHLKGVALFEREPVRFKF